MAAFMGWLTTGLGGSPACLAAKPFAEWIGFSVQLGHLAHKAGMAFKGQGPTNTRSVCEYFQEV
jgi:hypothetical protein